MTNNHRAYATSIMAGANPFHLEIKRALALRPLKRVLVARGGSGRRVDFEFVRRLFIEIPELRSA